MGMVEAYLDAEEAMIRRGGFDVLGHSDLVKMNNHRKDAGKLFSENSDFYKSRLSSLAKLMAERPLDEGAESPVCEINTGGLNRGKINECYPSLGFLKLLRAHNVPVVINSDAHRAIDLDGHYEDAHKTLLEAGDTETALFEGRIADKAVWKPTPL
jgi:histidinol-phosphatase (PHP family)